MLDAIILSDLHLGASNCQVGRLEKFFLELPPTARLILDGDVLEGTAHRLTRHHWHVLSLLRKLSDRVEIVWVMGNHDYDAGAVAHLVGANFVPAYAFTSANLSCLCVHGHAWDDFIARRPWLTWLADQAYLLAQRISPRYALRLKRGSKTFLRCCDKVRVGAVRLADSTGHDAVICGHTHHAETVRSGNLPAFYNCGSWTEPACHYVSVLNGNVVLRGVSDEGTSSCSLGRAA